MHRIVFSPFMFFLQIVSVNILEVYLILIQQFVSCCTEPFSKRQCPRNMYHSNKVYQSLFHVAIVKGTSVKRTHVKITVSVPLGV